MKRQRGQFGRRLRNFREAAGLTQEGLAEKADLSRNHVGLLETGRRDPSLSTLLALSRGLGVSLGKLADPSEPPPVRRSPTKAHRKIEGILAACSEQEVEAIAAVLVSLQPLLRQDKGR